MFDWLLKTKKKAIESDFSYRVEFNFADSKIMVNSSSGKQETTYNVVMYSQEQMKKIQEALNSVNG